MYRFRVTGEYFDARGNGIVARGGNFVNLSMARRAARVVIENLGDVVLGMMPDDLMEVATVSEEGTIEVALYDVAVDGTDNWIMSFDPVTGAQNSVTSDAALVWKLVKRGRL